MTSSWSMTTLIVFALFSLLLQHVSAAPSPISVYTTTPLDPSIRLSPQPSLALNKSCPTGLPTLSVSSTQQQPLLGFGAALTETTAYNFALLKARNQSAYTELLNSLFAPYPLGIGISFLRVPITSCDLSLPTPGWSYDDTPGDLNLTHFNTSHGEAYQIPILQDIMALSKQHNTQLRLLGSPWSAPSWIKDSQAWGYGTIENQYYDWYARYFVKLIQTFAGLGLPLHAITLQNEPRFEPGSYPGTRLSPQNESALANILKPLLRAANISTLVAAYDHNWDLVQYPLDVMAGAGNNVDVIAFHCYAGGVSNQTVFHNAYPDVPIWFTECSQTGNEDTPQEFLDDFTDNLNGLYFGNLDNWGRTVTHWSMAVDLNLGPHSGGCATCSGVVTVDVPSNGTAYTIRRNNEYYTLGHFAAFIQPGSVKLASTQSGGSSWSGLAVLTAGPGRVVELLNNAGSAVQVAVTDDISGCCFVATIAPHSLSTFVWSDSSADSVVGGSSGASSSASSVASSSTGSSTASSTGSSTGTLGSSSNGAGITSRMSASVAVAVALACVVAVLSL